MSEATAPGGAGLRVFEVELADRIRLSCRALGSPEAPLVLFLHGFPEAGFVWEPVMGRLADRYHCVAPDLRGYGGSSAPDDPAAYRLDVLAKDVVQLVAALDRRPGGAAAVVGHDWGGVLAWAVAAAYPDALRRLVILNAPHPALFMRDLQQDAAQQSASAYMNFMRRPDAERLLAEHDFARLFRLFTNMGAADPRHPGGGWLDESTRERYREVWRGGLTGALNWYRASPMRPATPGDPAVRDLRMAEQPTQVTMPTLVLWGLEDLALPSRLLEGLEEHVVDLKVERHEDATHWLLHEHPGRVAEAIRRFVPAD